MATASAVMIQVPLPRDADVAEIDWEKTRESVRWCGELLRDRWIAFADEVIDRETGAYVLGISSPESVRWPYEGDELAVGVFNSARHAAAIEYGFAAFHLPDRIHWGEGKTKLSKNGTWYLRVPFQHNTPVQPGQGRSVASTKRAMPDEVFELAKRMKQGERLTLHPGRLHENIREMRQGKRGPVIGFRGEGPQGGRYVTPAQESTRAQMTARSRMVHVGNGRIATTFPGSQPSPASQAAGNLAALAKGQGLPDLTRRTDSIYEGLFRSGATNHGQYTTVRTITQDSPGWWIPARPGQYVARRVAEEMAGKCREAIERGFKADVERAMAQALAVPSLGAPGIGAGA